MLTSDCSVGLLMKLGVGATKVCVGDIFQGDSRLELDLIEFPLHLVGDGVHLLLLQVGDWAAFDADQPQPFP
eukprot:m.348957 g.348957  ORF g.348957 m.348957 type:complete len:72 (-) comp16564_c0_seq7:97-312(-)